MTHTLIRYPAELNELYERAVDKLYGRGLDGLYDREVDETYERDLDGPMFGSGETYARDAEDLLLARLVDETWGLTSKVNKRYASPDLYIRAGSRTGSPSRGTKGGSRTGSPSGDHDPDDLVNWSEGSTDSAR